VLRVATWPSPFEPNFVAYGAALGGFIGRLLATALRYDADKKMRMTVDGSYYGTGIALAVYLLANLGEVSLG